MKAERKQEANEKGGYALTPEVKAAIQDVHDALARRKLLDEAADASPARIAEIEQDANRLRGEIASQEADIVLCAEADAPAKEKAIRKLADELTAKERELSRAKARLDALEACAPEIDAAIDEAARMLSLEVGMLAESFKVRISEELREAVKPLLPIMEMARAVGQPFHDYFQAVYLPDPEGFILSTQYIGAIYGHVGINLLNGTSGEPNPITEVMAPVNAALTALRAHRAYAPLAKRPKPYVRKGAWDGPGGRTERPQDNEPEEPAPPRKTLEEALREPYVIKGDSSGIRTWKAANELNIARAMMTAEDSAG
ncbi:hypothetical protein [Ralstonia solanacearum]|uniref:hypothetical protein n=1 Tax=Ralstonia solanacearum TaxID=305 RepID=UPI000503D450|nr:hypothetical protein [Ralstonia solanacearum]KFX77209.1 hypothetical protein KR98_20370 [Ralstonia solanacearum]OCQ66597.1 hypothetical protein AR465_09070 [Ralstonia solanacearum]